MHYTDILAKFLEMFPQYIDQICQFSFKDGPYTDNIGVKLKSGLEFKFTYRSDTDWKLTRCRTVLRKDIMERNQENIVRRKNMLDIKEW